MPHNGKKRKRCHKIVDLKRRETKKKRDETNQETDNSENIQEENASPSKTDDLSKQQLNSAINALDVEQELEKSACKSNLSVFNVKSIIHVSKSIHFHTENYQIIRTYCTLHQKFSMITSDVKSLLFLCLE